ncbi:phosphoglycolate phosphatase [Plesiomonas shigelloides]|uniref:phosphoglycolate phosphatase n=1 Tax=Plesiomonas shigelloides TaxID=703 RepID=UPI001C04D702|nr:phosphoglycolate phosphatase [Plesiomonas shigelloides]QWK93643.1 phosphoglycolate phosphatase [Plesiomonas shigelloides]
MPWDAVLFDLDGTLLDTAADMAAAANHVLQHYGYSPLNAAQIQANTSQGVHGLLHAGFAGALPDDMTVLRARFLAYYHANVCRDTRLYPGVEALLQQLAQSGCPWGIVTNKPTALTQALLPYFPALAQPAVLVCADTLAQRKPHPAPMHHACAQLGLSESRTLYLGDAHTDIQAAQAAGMPSAVAGWGYISPDIDTREWGANGVFASVTEFMHWLATHRV